MLHDALRVHTYPTSRTEFKYNVYLTSSWNKTEKDRKQTYTKYNKCTIIKMHEEPEKNGINLF
jgi:hypothetical protein